jgi:hypothetical protein
MLPYEPLDTALADAVPLGQLPLGRTRGEGRDELFRVGLAEPVINPPLTDAERCGPDTVSWFAAPSLRLTE